MSSPIYSPFVSFPAQGFYFCPKNRRSAKFPILIRASHFRLFWFLLFSANLAESDSYLRISAQELPDHDSGRCA